MEILIWCDDQISRAEDEHTGSSSDERCDDRETLEAKRFSGIDPCQ